MWRSFVALSASESADFDGVSRGILMITHAARLSLLRPPTHFYELMNSSKLAGLLFVLLLTTSVGCGSSEPTVIEPVNYELSEQEQSNRERAEKALAEQRQ